MLLVKLNINIEMKKIIRLIKARIGKYKFNYYKTFIANFRLLPIKQAIRFPIVIYGKAELRLSNSSMVLKVAPRFGLIRWGINEDLFVPSKCNSMLLMIHGRLVINAPIRVSPGCVFRIINGEVTFGKYNSIGGGSKLLCNNKISIGDYSRFGFGTILCDTNFHYINHNGVITNCHGEIQIGKSIFVGNNSSIVKGAVLPDYAIVSSKSYVNKDFSEYQDGALIAGLPAKVLKSGFKRVSSPLLEQKIAKFFIEHTNGDAYIVSGDDMDNPEDLSIYYS